MKLSALGQTGLATILLKRTTMKNSTLANRHMAQPGFHMLEKWKGTTEHDKAKRLVCTWKMDSTDLGNFDIVVS
jgi:hypothetical protein